MKIIPILALSLFVAACSSSKSNTDYNLLAEYEPSEYVILPFRTGLHEMSTASDDTLTVAMLNALTPHVKVLFLYRDSAQLSFMKNKLTEWAVSTDSIVFMHSTAKGGGAITDKAPLILSNSKGELANLLTLPGDVMD